VPPSRPFIVVATGVLAAAPVAVAQFPGVDAEAAARWSAATLIRYDVTGEVADPHVQIPSADADLYADVYDKVEVGFTWDKENKALVGEVTFRNYPATLSNLVGMGPECPAGEVKGQYEHFDIVAAKVFGEAIELAGKRIRPVTSVAESCGSGRRTYAAAEEAETMHMAVPDPMVLTFGALLPPDGPFKVSADGRSFVMTALNDNWKWTYTPTIPAR
jgi:hypothetical protein